MTDFDHSDKIAFFNNDYNKIELMDLKITPRKIAESDYLLKIPFVYVYIDNILLDIGSRNNQIIIVSTERYDSCVFTITIFDKSLKKISEYQLKDENINCAFRMLKTITKYQSYGIFSIMMKYRLGEKLPHDIIIFHSFITYQNHRTSRIYDLCYDKYEDTIVMYLECMLNNNQYLEVWKKEKKWVCLRAERLEFNEPPAYTRIKQMECARHHIILGMMINNYRHIYLIDKMTLQMKETLTGAKFTHLDDYDDWFVERLGVLKEIDVLKKITEPLLKIILLYVS